MLYWNGLRKTMGIRDYISDETWYVPASINLARMVLRLPVHPLCNGGLCNYTIIVSGNCSLTGMEILAESYGARILREYSKLRGFAVEAPPNLTRELNVTGCVRDIVPIVLPDEEGINKYLNLEHPALVKLIYAVEASVFGPRLQVFRLTSFAFALLAAGAVYATVLAACERVGCSRREKVLAIIVAYAAIVLDPELASMGSVAMLDVYAAALAAASMAAAASGRFRVAGLLAGLAGACKYTGLFPLPALLLLAGKSRGGGEAARVLLLALVGFLAPQVPVIAGLGVGKWLSEVVWSLQWHTTSRPPGGPPYTNPAGLLLGWSPFTLYYVGSKPLLVATVNPVEVGIAFAVSIAALALAALSSRWDEWVLAAPLYMLSEWAGFLLVYLAGNHTLYLFYAVLFTPTAAAVLGELPCTVSWLAGATRVAMSRREVVEAAALAAAGITAWVAEGLAGVWSAAPPLTLLDYAVASLSHSKWPLVYAVLGFLAFTSAARKGRDWCSKLTVVLAFSGGAPSAALAPIVADAAATPASALVAGILSSNPAAALLLPKRRGALFAAGATVSAATMLLLEGATAPLAPLVLAVAAAAALALTGLPRCCVAIAAVPATGTGWAASSLLGCSSSSVLVASAAAGLSELLSPWGPPVLGAAEAILCYSLLRLVGGDGDTREAGCKLEGLPGAPDSEASSGTSTES